jgi:hypothetical protein
MWSIRVERRDGDDSAVGETVVRHEQPPSQEDPPHAVLAAARAWLAIARARLDRGDFGGAISSARRGLDELGEDYAPFMTEDDTDLKLLAADTESEAGRTENAAAITVRMLGVRTSMYAERHSSTVVS